MASERVKHRLGEKCLAMLLTLGLASLASACDTQNQPTPRSTPVPSPTQTIAPTLPDAVSTPEQLYPPADLTELAIQNLPPPPATLTYETANELTYVASLPTPAPPSPPSPTPTDTPIPPPTDTPNAEQNAIELVKNATLRTANSTPYVTSYPHIYSGDGTNYVGEWHDKPGAKSYSYYACGGMGEPTIIGGQGNNPPCEMPMTLTVAITFDPSQNAYTVIFSCAWIGRHAPDGSHSWTYQVNDNQQVIFLREEGDVLPALAV